MEFAKANLTPKAVSLRYFTKEREDHWKCKCGKVIQQTRRERLKSALYLRLKKRETFFLEKNLKFLRKKFLSENVAQCRKM